MNEIKAGTSLYILTMLLQRLEEKNAGLIKDMIEGVKSDQASISNEVLESGNLNSIFKETLATLERVSQLKKSD